VTSHADDHYDDEIDLVELVVNLWNEKLLIVLSTVIVSAVSLIYVFTATPVYKSSIQVHSPSPAEVSYLNQTPHYQITPKEIFAEFLSKLLSVSHVNKIGNEHSELVSEALNLKNDENLVTNLEKIRKIDIPNIKKKTNEIAPDQYFLTYEGTNRQKMQELILADLILAKNSTLEEIHERYKNSLQLKINELSRKQQLQLEGLEVELESRKFYVLSSRKDRLIQLREAVKIAEALKIKTPTSLAKLATSSASKQVEITAELNNNQDPLYLRGTKLLSAEINSLEQLSDKVFLDEKVRQLTANQLIIANNREINQLENILSSFADNVTDIQLHSRSTNTPQTPIKPKKALIIAMGILLGGILGIFLAIARIIYKNYGQKKAIAT
jgi:LPS O-antigen subunit length determinant protein (WzzB/FepE family)